MRNMVSVAPSPGLWRVMEKKDLDGEVGMMVKVCTDGKRKRANCEDQSVRDPHQRPGLS